MTQVRVAVAQIASLPAVFFDMQSAWGKTHHVDAIAEPFFFLSTPGDFKLHAGYRRHIEGFRALQDDWNGFRDAYLHRLRSQVKQIIMKSIAAGVDLLLFPESSIPHEILSDTTTWLSNLHIKNNKSITVVLGTHELKRDKLHLHLWHDQIAARVGDKWKRISISPVINSFGLVELVFKEIRSRYEHGLDLPEDKGRFSFQVEASDPSTQTKVAVAICAEFLGVDAPPDRWGRMQESFENASIVLIPAWTPTFSQFIEEVSHFAKTHRQTIPTFVFCNTAAFGGSFIATYGDDFARPEQPLQERVEGILIRDVTIYDTTGRRFGSNPKPLRWHYFLEDSRPQQQLWSIAGRIQNGRPHQEEWSEILRNVGEISSRVPLPLREFIDAILSTQDGRVSVSTDAFWILDHDSTVASLILRHLADVKHYLDKELETGSYGPELTSLLNFTNQKLALLRDLVPVERQDVFVPERPSSLSLNAEAGRYWEKFVASDPLAEHHFALRVISVPSETIGVAYQTRIVSQLIDLLSTSSGIKSVELRYVTKSAGHLGVRSDIFILFQFDFDNMTHDDAAMLAAQLFNICGNRLFVYRLTEANVCDTKWFSDANGDSSLSDCQSRYFISRARASGTRPAFLGRGEARSVLYLMANVPGVARLRIRLERPTIAIGDRSEDKRNWTDELDWATGDHANGASNQTSTAFVSTSVGDLQDLQDASTALAFEADVFRPGSQQGTTPLFPARITFESDIRMQSLVAESIALELTGPRHFEVTDTDPKSLTLSERECFHVLKLPFGEIPGFKPDDRQFTAPDDIQFNPSAGLFLGEIQTQRRGRQKLYWDDVTRCQHMHVVGKSGTGKSYFLSSLISRDIQAGRGVMVLDPHGDLIETVLPRIPKERLGDLVLFDPGDHAHPPGLNLFEANLADHFERSMVMDEAVSMFLKLHGPEIFGPRIQQHFRGAVLSLMDYGLELGIYPTLLDIARIFVDSGFRRAVRDAVKDPSAKLFWKEFDEQADRERKEMIPYFQAKFGALLNNRIIRNVVGQQRSLIRFRSILERDSIVLVNLSKGRLGDINASLLGLIVIAKLSFAVMARASLPQRSRQMFSLYVDEFQNVASTAFSHLLSEARKYRLSMVLAHQYLSQLKLYDPWVRSDPDGLLRAVNGNVGTMVSFRVSNVDGMEIAKELRIKDVERGAMALQTLPDYQALITTAVGGQRLPATYFYSVPWEGLDDPKYGKEVEVFAKNLSCEVLHDVEEMIDNRLMSST